MSLATRFLERVWSAQPQKGFAFLSWFDEAHEWDDLSTRSSNPPVSLPNEGLDVYFAPCLFSERKRRKPHALPGVWLYADLDEVDPKSLTDLIPTITWATSKGRYQALWLLDKPLDPSLLARLNQRVTYYTKADKGGWSLTKVLRVPGSVSTKHGYNWGVKLLWDDGPSYAPKQVAKITKGTKTPASVGDIPKDVKIPKVTPSRILRRRKPSAKARKLYKAKEARGDRSARLWELECLLLKAGCTPEETLVVVRPTVWNKYAGQDREVAQLWIEINKALATLPSSSGERKRSKSKSSSTSRSRKRKSKGSRSSSKESSSTQSKSKSKKTREKRKSTKKSSRASKKRNSRSLELVDYNHFLAERLHKPGWLVEGVWSEKAHGVLAGEAKTYKSVISTDLTVSVASGTPFLGHFKIPATGPVLVIQEENDPGEFQDRLRRIAFSRGLTGHAALEGDSLTIEPDVDLPIHLLNNQGFDLTSKEDLAWLRRQCRRLKPALLVLDPFYLMTPGIDENSAAQVGPVLSRLLKMKQNYGVGIQLIHHYRKQNSANPIYGAARMSGTGVFHRWFESAVYVEKNEKKPFTVRLMPDHRGHAPQGAINITFDLGTDQDLHYEVNISQAKADKASMHLRLEKLLGQKDDWTINDLRIAMGMNSSKPLKAMIEDHGHSIKKVKTGQRGRPRLIVVSGDE